MFTEKLAIEKEVRTESFDEAINLVNTDFLVSTYGSDLKELSLGEDGLLTVSKEKTLPLTDWAFESLCTVLKMPREFARRIPTELMLTNFDELKRENNKRVAILISRGNVINITPVEYLSVGNAEILQRTKDVVERLDYDLSEIKISDRGLEISILKKNATLEPVLGDITRFGLSILNSETGFRNGAKASCYLWRLVCRNGATVSNSWGTVEWAYDHRISQERAMENFVGGIEKFCLDYGKFSEAYKRSTERELVAHELINYHRRVNRLVGNDRADHICKVTKEERSRLNREVREGNKNILTGIIAYDLYNNVTQTAKEFPFAQRRGLEALGGSLIDLSVAAQ